MTNPFKKKAKTLHVWEYEPYAFEPGRIYVLQVDLKEVSTTAQLADLDKYFRSNGVNVKLVPFANKPPIQPITVKRMTEES